MQSVVKGALEHTAAAMAGMVTPNKKLQDMQKDTTEYTPKDLMTNDHGVKHGNPNEWLSATSADRQGPALLEDNFGREKIMRFDHERIPERVVHARGTGAFGHFKLYDPIPELTCAGVLTDTSRTTPVFVRFSTVLGSRGSADTVRDVRGFAVKFYTDEGNWDIVGNDIPVFFIQDGMKFPDVIHAAKPEPDLEIPQAQTAHNNFWDFINLRPESSHMFLWAMSDRGIPRSYRMMQGFGVNTFTLINAEGKRTFVKFTWTPTLGVHSLVWDEALKIAGQDPDFHRRDLADAIGHGVFPTWKFGIQTCEEEKADDFDFDILDATKVWPEELFPIRYIGEIQLNKNPEEYFPQVEQAAFCTAHVVPGIGFSDDPLLQTRNFSYFDTQLSRLGVNWQQLPVNRPVCPVMNFNRDGAMQHRIQAGKTNYWPNRHSVVKPATAAEGAYIDYPEKIVAIKQRLLSKKFGEHFSQAQLFWNSMSPHEKTHIIDALGFELDHCDDPLVYEPMVERLADIDLGLAQAVAEKVGAPVPEKQNRPNHGRRSKGLSQTDFTPEALGFEPTIATRMIGILIADGFNYSEYEAVKMALTSAGALCFTIGPKRSPVIPSSGGKGVRCEHHFEGMRSTAFDSLYIPGGKEGVQNLMKRGRAVHWIREAFGHLKAIGATGEAVELVRAAVGVEGMTFSTTGDDVVDSYGVITAGGVGDGPSGVKETLKMVKGAKRFVDAYAYAIAQHRNYDRELKGLADQVAF